MLLPPLCRLRPRIAPTLPIGCPCPRHEGSGPPGLSSPSSADCPCSACGSQEVAPRALRRPRCVPLPGERLPFWLLVPLVSTHVFVPAYTYSRPEWNSPSILAWPLVPVTVRSLRSSLKDPVCNPS